MEKLDDELKDNSVKNNTVKEETFIFEEQEALIPIMHPAD